jgi:hypothetical protein
MATTTFSGPVVSTNGFSSPSTVTALSGSAVVAGGAALLLGTTSSVGVYVGSGDPTGVTSAAKGSLYLRTDGSSTSTRAYINTDGGNGWTDITTAT